MSEVTEFLIRSSEKIIGHYQFLLERATRAEERERFRSRIEQELKLIDTLRTPDQRAA